MQFNVLTGFTFLNNQTCYNEIFIFINKRSNKFFVAPLIFWAYLVNSQSSKLPCEICLLCQDVDDWFNLKSLLNKILNATNVVSYRSFSKFSSRLGGITRHW